MRKQGTNPYGFQLPPEVEYSCDNPVFRLAAQLCYGKPGEMSDRAENFGSRLPYDARSQEDPDYRAYLWDLPEPEGDKCR